MSRLRIFVPVVVIAVLIAVLGACNTAPPPPSSNPTTSDPAVQMVPDPTDATTSTFAAGLSTSATRTTYLDDSVVEVSFTRGFTFPFFGTAYSSVWINTNGGVTFGGGSTSFYMAASAISASNPGIAILWSDLDPSLGDPANADQIDYQQFDDHFVITYTQLPEYTSAPAASRFNTMTLTLYDSGKVTMSYDTHDTTQAVVGVFDGSGTGYVNVGLTSPATYDNYSASPGTIVFDADASVPTAPTVGQLNGMTLTFNP